MRETHYTGDYPPIEELPIMPTWPYEQPWAPTIMTTNTQIPTYTLAPTGPKSWVKGRIEKIGSRRWTPISGAVNATLRIVVLNGEHSVEVRCDSWQVNATIEPGASFIVQGNVDVRAKCGHSAPVRTAKIRVDVLA